MCTVWKEAGLDYKPKGRDSRREIAKQMDAAPDLFIGAFDGKKLVGVCIASDDGRRGWINRLAILPGYWGKGIAKKLVLACEKRLRRRGRRIFCAQVEEENKRALKLFKRCNYLENRKLIYLSKRDSDQV